MKENKEKEKNKKNNYKILFKLIVIIMVLAILLISAISIALQFDQKETPKNFECEKITIYSLCTCPEHFQCYEGDVVPECKCETWLENETPYTPPNNYSICSKLSHEVCK